MEKNAASEALESLPPAVKNWLQAIGAVGREPIRRVTLKQTGTMKLKPEQKQWTTSESHQICYTDPPAFQWDVKMKLGPGIYVTGKDSFQDGQGSMHIKLAGILPISKTIKNEKTDQSSLQRYLMELAWYPTASVGPHISWEEVDAYTATATLKYGNIIGSATFFFNQQYELMKVEAWRYKDNDDNAPLLLCTGTIQEHQLVDGLKIPVKLEISWQLEHETFTWYRFRVSDIHFDTKRI